MTEEQEEPPQPDNADGQLDPRSSENELHWLEKLNFISQSCLVLVGIAAASIYGCQLHTMNGQLQQMKGSSQQTDRLLCLYQQQLSKLDQSISEASRLATATETANSNVLAADRPWFGAILTAQDSIEVGKVPSATIQFINSGKRPAKVTISQVADHWFNKFPKNPPYPDTKFASSQMVVPGSVVISKFNLSKVPLSQGEINTATAGTPVRLFLYANIDYVDMRTGERHFTHACWQYVGNEPAVPKGFYNCSVEEGYNDAN